ncbi:MAG TPA: amino acid adenylation domain-containing protein [Thermoanaerobaculia bacterium]|nr:amino acid adenylation domain-containing protein [Thermoanaerobaculia bacterium]
MAENAAAAAEGLSARQRQLLELMQQQRRQAARAAAAPPAVPRRPPGEPPVLSFAQQRLWFIEQLQPGSAAYHIPGAVRIRGALDLRVLASCLVEVARRHETLRTGVALRDGEPVPVLAAEPRLPLPVVDLSALPEPRREPEATRVVHAQVALPFDLTRPPLARACLLRLAPEEAVFLLVLQHVIGDIWSIGVFFRNTMDLYDAFSAGLPSPLPELPVQYTDFAAWQQRALAGDGLRTLLDYWKGQIEGAPLAIELPTDHPRPPLQSFTGGRRYMTFPAGLTARLKALATQQDATLYMILLAALDALLYRLTGQRSLLVGVPMANRGRRELEGLIGLLLNTLVLRADLDGSTSFRELLGEVRERHLGAIQHQDLLFERLVEELRVERDMSRNPIYQVLFNFQNVPRSVSSLDAQGLRLSRYEVLEAISREDLELALRETPEGELAGWFGYDEALFDPATVERIAGQLGLLLAGIAEDPERRVGELPLLTAAEEQALCCEWNDTAAAPPPAALPELVATQAARTPDAVAVEDGERSLTYRELLERAAGLAATLAGAGLRRGDLVGVLARRSVDLPAVVLGVHAAGGAYLPLSPDHPPRRHAQVLEQGRVGVVVAEEELAGALAEARGVRVVSFKESFSSFESLQSFGSFLTPADLAYVIFTSGSTGLPKGAAIPQRGLVNHVLAKIEELGIGPGDTVAQTASQSFDISLWQMLAALVVGGRVRVVPDEVAHDPARLLGAVEAAGITVLEIVPSVLRMVLEEARRLGAERPPLARLRWLVSTGEALPPELWGEWLEVYPRVALLNAYGPTECADRVTHQRLPLPPAPGTARTPIGGPLRNTRLAVVDAELRLAPIGVAGELCIGGAGVGQGYLHDPARTALAFVPDPTAGGAAPGARLYRTGDRARRRADGGVEFLGRIDFQVKVRGFRIELGEIETALGQAPGVRQAVVLVRDDRLVAYVVLDPTDRTDRSDRSDLYSALAAWLGDRLPQYMVPAVFVRLDALPLTPNGKLDRRALAAFDPATGLAARADHVAPRNPVEESLAGIWTEVLKRPGLGVYDDFFAAGGQSLLATQVVTRVREAFGVDLPVRTLFQKPTIAGFAESLEVALLHGRGLPPAPPMTRIPDAERQGPLPPSFGQERLWFIDQRLPGLSAYNIFGAVRMRGRLDVAVLRLCFEELVRRHEVLRTTFAAPDGRPMQIVGPPRAFPIPRVDLSGLPAERRGAWSMRLKDEEAERPFDLARGPLLRAVLLRLEDEDHILVVTAHHVVYDVWSRELLIRELGTLYEAFWHRRPSPLPELAIQYADFARWQRRWLSGEGLAAQLDYWKRQLAGVTTGTELPGDRPRPPVQSFRGQRHLLQLAPRATAALKELSRRHGVTLFMTLLAGFEVLLHRATGEDDVVVGSPIANRNRAETEALIGFFVNTQVLRTRLDGDPSLRQVLGRVRETALAAYAHQDVAFEQVVTALRASRDPARQPLFQILFNFLTNYQPIVLELPELTLAPETNHSGAVQFDLVSSLYEADGRLHMSVDYSSDLFDRATIQRTMDQYAALLEAAAAEPGRPVSEISFWSAGERQQLLVEWAEGERLDTDEDTARIHELILAQAARTPEAPAIAHAGELVTYGELAARARRLARRLRARGVGPEVLVGIRLERGPEALVAILAVLEAGGAYLPLDPAYPEERLAFMAADAGAWVVVTQEDFKDQKDFKDDKDLGDSPLESQNTAYVIYTSGSTGRPKGVAVTHRGLLRSTRARLEGYPEPVAAFLLLPSLAFDSSVAVIFWTLCQGGCLVIPEEGKRSDPGHLARLIAAHGVSHWLSIPRLYALLLAQAPPEDLASLRAVIVAGEACTADLVAAHRARLPGAALYNEYGPTEGTVWATVDGPAGNDSNTGLPIGRPIAGVRVRLLDAALTPVPAGVPAELLIGGGNLARGYLGRPELTAERFLPDPFAGIAAEPGARLYRTGDLARWLPDGRLDFLGRVDQQVKIRGVRIELGEIEAALKRHPAVREAALLVREDQLGDRRLVAYLVAGPELAGEPARLRAFLRQGLPDAMLPGAFVFLDALPLTATGKVDRRALAALDVSELARETPFVAPRTPLEERLAAIWSELLGVQRIGALDNFFHLGGHSLLTTQLVSRLRAEFELEVPLPSFFDDPTVAGLAQVIELARWAEEVARQVPEACGEAAAELVEMEEGEL